MPMFPSDKNRMFKPTVSEISKNREPGFGGLSIARFQCEDLLAAVAHRADNDQQTRLVALESGFDIDAIGQA